MIENCCLSVFYLTYKIDTQGRFLAPRALVLFSFYIFPISEMNEFALITIIHRCSYPQAGTEAFVVLRSKLEVS
jgi:hypothetical protein